MYSTHQFSQLADVPRAPVATFRNEFEPDSVPSPEAIHFGRMHAIYLQEYVTKENLVFGLGVRASVLRADNPTAPRDKSGAKYDLSISVHLVPLVFIGMLNRLFARK